MQVVDYLNIRDTLVDKLKSVNTTTADYDISNSLTSRVVDISSRNISLEPLMQTEYPYITVNLVTKNAEELESFGNSTSDRSFTINGEIYCIYDSGNYATTQDNLLRMVRNVEANIRSYLTFNSYLTAGAQIVSIVPGDVDFQANVGAESAYNRTARIDIGIQIEAKDI